MSELESADSVRGIIQGIHQRLTVLDEEYTELKKVEAGLEAWLRLQPLKLPLPPRSE